MGYKCECNGVSDLMYGRLQCMYNFVQGYTGSRCEYNPCEPTDPCLNPNFPNPKPLPPFQDWNNDNQEQVANVELSLDFKKS